MAERVDYKHLKPKPGSNYRQLFVNGRIKAEIIYRETVGLEPLTPEAVAAEYGLRSAALAPSHVDPADVHDENGLTATFSLRSRRACSLFPPSQLITGKVHLGGQPLAPAKHQA